MFNSASLISPTGAWTSRYSKMHLVPFGEYVPFASVFSFASGLTQAVGNFTPGTLHEPLQAGDQKLGIFICYESIFPNEVRQLADQGADVLVNISNDGWYGDSGAWAQHLNQARMRAVENNRWLLRDTNTGLTSSSRTQDPRRAGRALRTHQRNHLLLPTRRLVRPPVCDNFHRSADRALHTPAKDRVIVHGRRTRTAVHRAERESPHPSGVPLTRANSASS